MFTNSLAASQKASRLYYEDEAPKAPNGTYSAHSALCTLQQVCSQNWRCDSEV